MEIKSLDLSHPQNLHPSENLYVYSTYRVDRLLFSILFMVAEKASGNLTMTDPFTATTNKKQKRQSGYMRLCIHYGWLLQYH